MKIADLFATDPIAEFSEHPHSAGIFVQFKLDRKPCLITVQHSDFPRIFKALAGTFEAGIVPLK
ncbi:hypothetical protein [Paraburkholderia bannensis]|uniref:hypothetical protein n=1 Tax=Paraburkholderia bannensis TaxID=765414 RepID=UPI002AC332CD|nr:hypothetical protein [Paraburkholderia bannensis]